MITVLFQTESHYPVQREKIKKAIVEALQNRVKRNTELSVSIIGDRLMRKLNKTYRDVDSSTDVLSFPLNDSTYQSRVHFVEAPDDILRLGDIVISFPQAILGAAEENKLVDDKIVELALHGLNHLLGIHHPE